MSNGTLKVSTINFEASNLNLKSKYNPIEFKIKPYYRLLLFMLSNFAVLSQIVLKHFIAFVAVIKHGVLSLVNNYLIETLWLHV